MDEPEALFLAQELEAPLGTVISSEVDRRAAAELLRLHDENEMLRQQRDRVFTALVQISLLTHLGGEVAEYGDVVDAVRQMRDHMISEGWRQCAQGQKTSQFCAVAEQARAEEREACARVCDAEVIALGNGSREGLVAGICAAAIRARGQPTNEDNPSF
jgi:hypothetical protein